MQRILAIMLSIVFLFSPVASVFAGERTVSWIDYAPTIESEKKLEVAPVKNGAKVEVGSGSTTTSDTNGVMSSGGGGATSGQPGTAVSKVSTESAKLPESDARTGALSYGYPLTLPAGVLGVQPDLSVSYNSQGAQEGSQVGFGWSLGIPSISRMNKNGTTAMYSAPVFQSSMDGELRGVAGGSGIAPIAGQTHEAKVNTGATMRYTFANGSWTVVDKKGTTYRFGVTAAARQDDPADASRVFAWLLDEVEDAHGNMVRYSYVKSQGAVYPSAITYTDFRSPTKGTIGNGVFRVEFVREARPDVVKSGTAGFTVVTAERIREVKVYANSALVRSYVFGYSTGSSGARSLLTSITESGRDPVTGASATLPATTFSYSAAMNVWADEEQSTFDFPDVQFSDHYYGRDLGVRMGDLNGDGWLDAIQSYFVSYTSQPETGVWLHNGGQWVKQDTVSGWVLPEDFYFIQHYDGGDRGARVADVNGDGRVDLVKSVAVIRDGLDAFDQGVYINNGAGWTLDASWVFPPVAFVRLSNGQSQGVRMVDVNGDGMVDVVKATRSDKRVYINTGTGWVQDTTWNFGDAEILDNTERELGTDFYDVDGDGLPDIVVNYLASPESQSQQRLYRNTGKGFVLDNSWVFPSVYFTYYYDATDFGGRMGDLNGDGLPELFISKYSGVSASGEVSEDRRVYRNTGTGFVLDASIALPDHYFFNAQTRRDNGTRIVDVDGDGVSDIVASFRLNNRNADNTWQTEESVYAHERGAAGASRADVLTGITLSKGGSVAVEYSPTTFSQGAGGGFANAGLPMIIDAVDRLVVRDGFGTEYVTQYAYEGGVWYANGADRKFAGFRVATKTLPDGSVVKSYSHQGNGNDSAVGETGDHIDLAGQVFRVEEFAVGGSALMRRTQRKWQHAPFAVVVREDVATFDGDNDSRVKTVSMTYDAVGNVLEQRENELGGAAVFERVMIKTYAVGVAGGVLAGAPTAFVSSELLRDGVGVLLRETRQMYDGLSFGVVAKGDVTRAEKRSRVGADADAFVASTAVYGASGLVTSETDPRGFTTSYVYDGAGYVTSTTNALGYVELTTHDAVTGELVSKKDMNGKPWKTVLDPMGRVVQVFVPDPASGVLVLRESATYVDTAGAVSMRVLSYVDAVNARETAQYFDGLGRVIQVRKEMDPIAGVPSNDFATTNSSYDYAGRVVRETLPYVSAGVARTSATFTPALTMTSVYDALGRVVLHGNVFGVETVAYDQWGSVHTDLRGSVKRLMYDAFGQLVRVEEVYSPTETFVTMYGYDVAGSLAYMINAIGESREFSYDLLGRRLSASALHDAGVQPGKWRWEYDAAGNVTVSTDPRGVTTTSTYDALGRVLSQDGSLTAGVESTWTYDTCTFGRGRVCRDVLSGVETVYSYDPMGNAVSETKIIDGVIYATTSTFNRGGSPLVVTLPDASEVRYEYNGIGLVERVTSRERGEVPFTTVLAGVDYGVTDQAVVERYGAGHEIRSEFDAAAMYRLASRVTRVSTMVGGVLSQVDVQNVAYTYDAAGNVTRVVDTSAAVSGASAGVAGSGVASKTVDYGYDAVGRLVSEEVSGVSAGAPVFGAGATTRTWTYDAVGTVLGGPAGATVAVVRDAAGAVTLEGAAGTVGSSTYEYDFAGRMRLSEVITGIGAGGALVKTVSTNTYDVSGARVKSVVIAGGITRTVISPNAMYSIEGSGSTAKRTKHVMVGGRSVATFAGVGTWGSSGMKRYVSAGDHLGSSSVMFDLGNGTVAAVMDYYAFGSLRIDDRGGSGASGGVSGYGYDEKRKFGGAEFDRETGLSLMGARYYDAGRGRFMSTDPVFVAMGDVEAVKQMTGSEMMVVLTDPQALGPYVYARNNPMKYVDPDGEWAFLAPLLASAVIASANYAPRVLSFASSLLTPVGQHAVHQSATDAKNGNYGSAIIGAVTAGEVPVGKTANGLKGIWSKGKVIDSVLNALGHWNKHRSEFPELRNAKEYVEKAWDFMHNPSADTLIGGRNSAEKVFYNQSTNVFGVLDKNGVPKTLLKPDPAKHTSGTNLQYFYDNIDWLIK